MFEDINFTNHIYTKISDLKLNKSIMESDNKLKYNENNLNRIIGNNSEYNENNLEYNNYLKYNNNLEHDNNSEYDNNKSDLDYLYYEENKPKKKKIKNNKLGKNNNKNKEIRLYILLFISFCFLNSYFVINIINSYRIQYKLSLCIRASLFLILYYIIKNVF